MPSRRRRRMYPRDVFMGIEASRRVGWARYYSEAERNAQYETACEIYRDRVDVLVAELMALVHSVLREKPIDTFVRAHRLLTLIEEFQKGRPYQQTWQQPRHP